MITEFKEKYNITDKTYLNKRKKKRSITPQEIRKK
jgi:hypothetical protein